MIPLDNYEKFKARAAEQNAADILNPFEKEQWDQLKGRNPKGVSVRCKKETPKGFLCMEILENLRSVIEHPVGFNLKHWVVFNWYLKTKWLDAFRAVNLKAPAAVAECATGSGDKIPQVLAKYFCHAQSKYVSVNLNKQLTADFKRATHMLPLDISVAEDAAQNIGGLFAKDSLDAVVFEHAFNDIAEDLVAKRYGIDTVNLSWWDIMQKLIDSTNDAYRSGAYEPIIKEDFLRIIKSSLSVLKPGAFVISYQFHYQADIDMGIDPNIWSDITKTVRRWLAEEKIGREIFFDGFEPNWWLFIQKA
ncbi:MAG: hypothetical protein FWE82_01290 [Defluviitaleaceae bacterium]|nr:hypothetical protein [Defluviitaleaceae bacterium]